MQELARPVPAWQVLLDAGPTHAGNSCRGRLTVVQSRVTVLWQSSLHGKSVWLQTDYEIGRSVLQGKMFSTLTQQSQGDRSCHAGHKHRDDIPGCVTQPAVGRTVQQFPFYRLMGSTHRDFQGHRLT